MRVLKRIKNSARTHTPSTRTSFALAKVQKYFLHVSANLAKQGTFCAKHKKTKKKSEFLPVPVFLYAKHTKRKVLHHNQVSQFITRTTRVRSYQPAARTPSTASVKITQIPDSYPKIGSNLHYVYPFFRRSFGQRFFNFSTQFFVAQNF